LLLETSYQIDLAKEKVSQVGWIELMWNSSTEETHDLQRYLLFDDKTKSLRMLRGMEYWQ